MSKAAEITLMPKETEVNRIIYVTLAIVYGYIVSAGVAIYQLF